MLDFGVPPLLETLDDEIRKAVLDASTSRVWRDGTTIQLSGDEYPVLYIVLEGAVRITRVGSDGAEYVIVVFGPGQSFGDLQLIHGNPRAYDAVAVGAGRIAELRKPAFDRLWNEYPAFGKTMLSLSAQRLQAALALIDDLRRLDLPERCAKLILGMVSKDNRQTVEIGQETLAQVVGASRVSIGRALNVLKDEGLVSTGYGKLSVPDTAKLSDWLSARIDFD